MENTKRILKYQYRDSKESIIKFWATMLVVNIFFFIINKNSSPHSGTGLVVHTTGQVSVSIVGVNLMALAILLIVFNYENYYGGFPLAIGFSITRKDFVLSLMAKTVFIVLSASIIQGVLFLLDSAIVDLAGKSPFYDFIIFNTSKDNILYIIFSLFMIFLTLSSIWNLIASVNYRFGYLMWIVYLGIFFVFTSFSPLKNIGSSLWKAIGEIFTSRIDMVQFLKLSMIIVVSQALAYLNTINMDIKSKA